MATPKGTAAANRIDTGPMTGEDVGGCVGLLLADSSIDGDLVQALAAELSDNDLAALTEQLVRSLNEREGRDD